MEIDWARYVGQQLGEHRHIDFKAPCSWAGEGRAKLTADILAASHIDGGGVIVIGVEEDAEKKLKSVGCTPEQVRTFDKTDVVLWVAQHAQPEVDLTIEKPTTDVGHTMVVIRVSEFRETPIIVTRELSYQDGTGRTKVVATPGDIMMRTNAAQTCRVRSADDMRLLVHSAVRKTRDATLRRFRELLDAESRSPADPGTIHEDSGVRWREALGEWTSTRPNDAFVQAQVIPTRDLSASVSSLEELRKRVSDADVVTSQTQFPGIRYANSIENVGASTRWKLGDATAWLAHRTGAFYYVDDMAPALSSPESVGRLYFWYPCLTITGCLRFASRYYAALGGDVDLQIVFRLEKINGLLLFDNGEGFLPYFRAGELVARVPAIEVPIATSALKLEVGWALEAEKAIAQVLETFQVSDARRLASNWLNKAVPGSRT
jgi:hypothetical protein